LKKKKEKSFQKVTIILKQPKIIETKREPINSQVSFFFVFFFFFPLFNTFDIMSFNDLEQGFGVSSSPNRNNRAQGGL
jgi:hypothetical protein